MTIRLVAATMVVAFLAYLTSPIVPILPILLLGGLVAWRGQEETKERVLIAEKDEADEIVPDANSL